MFQKLILCYIPSRTDPVQTPSLSHLDLRQKSSNYSLYLLPLRHPSQNVPPEPPFKIKSLILPACLQIFRVLQMYRAVVLKMGPWTSSISMSLEMQFHGPHPSPTLDLYTGTQQSVFQQVLQMILMHTGVEAKIPP